MQQSDCKSLNSFTSFYICSLCNSDMFKVLYVFSNLNCSKLVKPTPSFHELYGGVPSCHNTFYDFLRVQLGH